MPGDDRMFLNGCRILVVREGPNKGSTFLSDGYIKLRSTLVKPIERFLA